MAEPPPAASSSLASRAKTPTGLRWHPARLLYLFLVTLIVGILYSEIQTLLANPASALDPGRLPTRRNQVYYAINRVDEDEAECQEHPLIPKDDTLL
jgi:hypothetical protein